MFTSRLPGTVAACCIACAAVLQSQTTSTIDQVSWLAGCWRQDANGRVIDEVWMTPAAGLMLGSGRTVANGRVVEFEFMQIREDGGRLVFIAKPSGQAEGSFPRDQDERT